MPATSTSSWRRREMSVMQDLYDSEINVETESFFDSGWVVRIGDKKNGFVAETIRESWVDVEAWLTTQAIERFPNSEFARQYRPRSWRRRPRLTLVEGKPSH